MKVLLTGGAGFIGSHTAVGLLEKGHEVVIADNFVNSKPEAVNRIRKITGKNVKLYAIDVADRKSSKPFSRKTVSTPSSTLPDSRLSESRSDFLCSITETTSIPHSPCLRQ